MLFEAGLEMAKRILIIENQEDMRLFLKKRLELLGFETVTASHEEDGLAVLETEPINGVLLDLETSTMNRMTLLNHLKKRFKEIPVIVMSADPTQSKMAETIKRGAWDYLVKPLSGEILNSKCQRLFG